MEEEETSAVEEDPVVNEVSVYLSQSLAKHLYLLQFPLCPAHLPYNSEGVVGVRVRPQQQQVEMDMVVRPRGENYSTSRGEHFARMVELSKPSNVVTEPYYKSGLMDKHTLTSDSLPLNTSRYAAAVFKDGELHLTPLHGLVQLRPGLTHLDKTDTGSKKVGVGGAEGRSMSEGETTESEGEEAKPVQVRFARPDSVRAAHSRQKVSYETQEQQREEEAWVPLYYHGVDSEEATEERQLLFASDEEDHRGMFTVAQSEYLDMVCPMELPEERSAAAAPSGVVSLSQLKLLPVPQQVHELLKSSHVMQFQQLCTLLGGRGQAPALLEAVQGCGVLVQGCWVVSSKVVFPEKESSMLQNARDYILWCFTQSRTVVRKDIAAVTKVTHEDIRDILNAVSVQKPAQGWEFKLPTDQEFGSKYSHIVLQQSEKWEKRYRELVSELGIPKEFLRQPSSGASHTKVHPHVSKQVSGEQVTKPALRRPKADGVPELKYLQAKSTKDSRRLSPTKLAPTAPRPPPLPHTLHTAQPPPLPTDMGEVTVSSEEECLSPAGLMSPTPLSPRLSMLITQATHKAFSFDPVKQEEPSQDLMDALMQFCREALGRGVLGLPEIKNKLLLKQASVPGEHPLREQGISEKLLESTLQEVGALEVGQASDRRLFALEHTGEQSDEYRSVVLKLFQTHRCLRRKQLLEGIGEEHPDNKTLNSVLREVCYSRGSQWFLHGT